MKSFPESSAEFARIHRPWLKAMPREDLETLAEYLLQKRDCDGLNGRCWDADRHLFYDEMIAGVLMHVPRPAAEEKPWRTEAEDRFARDLVGTEPERHHGAIMALRAYVASLPPK